jgi:hypothetical protein
MASTELKQQTPRALAPREPAPRRQVKGKLKRALDRVVDEGMDPYEAARAEGLLARSMRKALAKAHVLQYLRQARVVLREQARAQNIHHMIEMRRSSPNEMARLGAMKLIESEDDSYRTTNAHAALVPGLVIQILRDSRAPTEPMRTVEHIPADPAIEPKTDELEAMPWWDPWREERIWRRQPPQSKERRKRGRT